jgi:hypothetical protein
MRILISSTFVDRRAEREAAAEALRRSQLVPWGMELFVSEPSQPLKVCLEQVQLCEAAVLIIGFEAGSLNSRNAWTDEHGCRIPARTKTRQKCIRVLKD